MNSIHHELLFRCIQEENPEHPLLLILFLDVGNKRSICSVLHQLDQKIIYPHYDFKHLTEKYFEIGMKLNDFSIQLVKYCCWLIQHGATISSLKLSFQFHHNGQNAVSYTH